MTDLLRISEESFQAAVVRAAKSLGWDVYHCPDSRGSEWGQPDLRLKHDEACLIIEAELKSQTGQPTPEQTAWLEVMQKNGYAAFLWRPSDLAEILRLLDWEHRGVKITA